MVRKSLTFKDQDIRVIRDFRVVPCPLVNNRNYENVYFGNSEIGDSDESFHFVLLTGR